MGRQILQVALVFVIFMALACSRPSAAATQSQETLSYSVVGGGSYTPPLLNYTLNGHIVSVTLTTTPTSYSMDSGTTWAASEVLPSSNSTQRWMINGTNSGHAFGSSVVLAYLRQYFIDFGISAVGDLQTIRLPHVNYTYFGNLSSTYAGKSAWADFMSSYTYGGIPDPAPHTRWYVTGSTGLVEGPTITKPHYVEQYSLNFSLVSSGIESLNSATLAESYGGNTIDQTLPAAGASFWVDYHSTFSFPATISAGSGVRWLQNSISSSTAVAPANVTVSYLEEYQLGVSYSVSNGTAPAGPVLTATMGGQNASYQYFPGAAPAWVDAGSQYSISGQLTGSTASERWITTSATTGTATGPASFDLFYFHQVRVQLSYAVVGGGALSFVNATFVSFGVGGTTTIGATPTAVWADYGTVLGVQGSFAGQTPAERWELNSSPSVLLLRPVALPLAYYHQFMLTVTYAFPTGGTPTEPTFTGTALGETSRTPVASGTSLWLDDGSQWTLPGTIPGSQTGERWVAEGASSGTVGPSASIAVTFAHQFYVALVANPPAAGSTVKSGWAGAGETFNISATANPGWRFEEWQGVGQGSYTGASETTAVSLSGPINETASFYVSFTIKAVGSGSVSMSVGPSTYQVGGSPLTIFVPPGTNVTLKASPGFLQSFGSWVGIAAGSGDTAVVRVSSPLVASASFGINEVEVYGIIVLYFGIAAYIIAYLIWRKGLPLGRIRGKTRIPVTGLG